MHIYGERERGGGEKSFLNNPIKKMIYCRQKIWKDLYINGFLGNYYEYWLFFLSDGLKITRKEMQCCFRIQIF